MILKIIFSNAFLRSIIDFYVFILFLFFKTYNNEKRYRKSFYTKKKLNYTAIKGIIKELKTIKEIFLEKETKTIKDRILRDINNFFQHEKEEKIYYKPARVNNFWSNNYVEYDSNGGRNITLSIEELFWKVVEE